MSIQFKYPTNSINKNNRIVDTKLGQQVIRVPKFGDSEIERVYNNFYWIEPNPVTPLIGEDEEGNEIITYSKLKTAREAVNFLISGGNKYEEVIGGETYWFILLPQNFDIVQAEQWNIGGNFFDSDGGQNNSSETISIFSFVASRAAIEYAKSFTSPGDPKFLIPPVTEEDVVEKWGKKVAQLLA